LIVWNMYTGVLTTLAYSCAGICTDGNLPVVILGTVHTSDTLTYCRMVLHKSLIQHISEWLFE